MAQMTFLRINHDCLPTAGTIEAWGIDVTTSLRRGDPELLPDGVTQITSHHSQDLPWSERQIERMAIRLFAFEHPKCGNNACFSGEVRHRYLEEARFALNGFL